MKSFMGILAVGLVFLFCGGASAQLGGWTSVSVHDPEVVSAANFAVWTVQQKETEKEIILIKIVQASRQVVAGTNYKMELKLRIKKGGRASAEAVVWRKLSGDYELTSWTWLNL
ncbi:MAG: hypothetical protein JW943_10835 [Deltaproteobacteria bacterium]|nr:hypothetical protein [Deltaproteobacteria bacterium]